MKNSGREGGCTFVKGGTSCFLFTVGAFPGNMFEFPHNIFFKNPYCVHGCSLLHVVLHHSNESCSIIILPLPKGIKQMLHVDVKTQAGTEMHLELKV